MGNYITLNYREEAEAENSYDCRVMVDSFYSLLHKESWTIKFQDWNDYEKRKKERFVTVGVLGYEKSGKSFILSNLTGKILPQGKHVKTNGISLLFPTE